MNILKSGLLLSALVLLAASVMAQNPGSAAQDSLPEPTTNDEISDIFLNTVWKNIDELTTTEKSFEVEKITTVAGVRGAEAEDEATKHLYYRGSMRIPDRAELRESITRLEAMITQSPNDKRVPELQYYIIQCYLQLGDEKKASELHRKLQSNYPDSKWSGTLKAGTEEPVKR